MIIPPLLSTMKMSLSANSGVFIVIYFKLRRQLICWILSQFLLIPFVLLYICFIYLYICTFFFLYGLVSLIIIYLLKSLIFFRNFFFFWPLLYQICNQLIQFVVIYAKRISLITNQNNLLLNEIYESKETIKCISIEE